MRRLVPFALLLALLLPAVALLLPAAARAQESAPEGLASVLASAAPLGTADGTRPLLTFQPAAADFQLVAFRLDALDVTALVETEGSVRRYVPLADLPGGEHVVEIAYTSGGAARSVSWRFTTPLPPPTPQSSAGWSLQGEAARAAQEPLEPAGPRVDTTPLAGTPHVEGAIGSADGATSAAFNASLAQQYERHNPPTHVSVPAVILGAKSGRVSATLGNGPVEAFAPSLLLNTVSTRRGLEVGLDTGIGTFRAFGNLDDGLPAANGVNEYRQNLYGASFMPALGSRVKLRLHYQYAADERDPLYDAPPLQAANAGEAAGAPPAGTPALAPPLFGGTPRKAQLVALTTEWMAAPEVNLLFRGEVARSAFSPDARTTPVDADWAYAVSASASPAGFQVQAAARIVRDGFGSPANPALLAGRHVYDVSLSRGFGALLLAATYARTTESGRALTPEGSADTGGLNAAYTFAKTGTSLALALQANSAASAGSTNEGTNASFSLSQAVAGFQLSAGLLAGRQKAGGVFPSESRTSGATLGLARMGEVFSLQGSLGWNRSRNALSAETTTALNAFLQPELSLFARKLSLTPMAVWARMRTTNGLGDADSFSLGGRVTVRTWGALKGLAFFGQYLESLVDPRSEGSVRTRDRKAAAGLVVLLGGGSLGPSIGMQAATPMTPMR